MSPYKDQHRVACAHCQKRSAGNIDCGGCHQAVCAACASDYRSCRRPAARVAQLGRGARLRAVDPEGRMAVVSTWSRVLRMWDVQARSYAEPVNVDRWIGSDDRLRLLALTRSGRLLDTKHALIDAAALCRCRDHLVSARAGSIKLGDYRYEDLMSRQVITCLGFDCDSRLLAVASHDRLVVYRGLEGERLERIGSVRTHGEVRWVGVGAGDRVVTLTVDGSRGTVRAYRCSSSVFYPLPFYEWVGDDRVEIWFRPFEDPPGEAAGGVEVDAGKLEEAARVQTEPVRASLSADGRFVAVAHAGSYVVVHDLAIGRTAVYGDHSDGICWLGIVGGDGKELLVTGDCDNRVVIRERSDHGFSRWLG